MWRCERQPLTCMPNAARFLMFVWELCSAYHTKTLTKDREQAFLWRGKQHNFPKLYTDGWRKALAGIVLTSPGWLALLTKHPSWAGSAVFQTDASIAEHTLQQSHTLTEEMTCSPGNKFGVWLSTCATDQVHRWHKPEETIPHVKHLSDTPYIWEQILQNSCKDKSISDCPAISPIPTSTQLARLTPVLDTRSRRRRQEQWTLHSMVSPKRFSWDLAAKGSHIKYKEVSDPNKHLSSDDHPVHPPTGAGHFLNKCPRARHLSSYAIPQSPLFVQPNLQLQILTKKEKNKTPKQKSLKNFLCLSNTSFVAVQYKNLYTL